MINKAIFKFNNGNLALLCSECGKIIKTGSEFDVVETLGSKGVVSLMARFCSEHEHLGLFGYERSEDMIKKGIKEKIREAIMRRNILNVEITRPNQLLKIMRGIPGSGKSTLAESLVGKGVIHSTDTLIEATGDYTAFFTRMVETGNWNEHSKMHNDNFVNAKNSMLEGVSPVIVDNTNIKASEPRKYVEAALKMGFDEANITIVDVGSGGVTAKALFERNTHGVPLKKIKSMISSHKSAGELTVKKILEAKGYGKRKSLYSGVFLDEGSKQKLLNVLSDVIPKGWKIFAHHMTTVFGKPMDDTDEYGKVVNLTATHVGISDMAMAVKVDGYPSSNAIPHITVAVNVNGGGKPFMSNKITNWEPLPEEIGLSGVVTEQTT